MDFYDNDGDGQLSMFDMAESLEDLQKPAESETGIHGQTVAAEGVGIRIRSCSSCGKLLYVREENGRYRAVCNACGITYLQ